MPIRFLPLAALAAPALAVAAGPLAVATTVQVEQRVAAADGTVRTRLVPAARAVPGDRLTVTVRYRNTGAQPIANLVLANPVPHGLAYRGAAAGAAMPEVSVDGRTFAALAALRVATPAGGSRPATLDDVTQVRWRLPGSLAAGQGGAFAFQAVLK